MNSSQPGKDNLLIVGSMAFDSVETPRGRVDMALGGSASFASLAASYTCSPQVVAIVGEDFKPADIDRFQKHGIDTDGIERVPGKTFHWRGKYRDNFKERDTLETCLNVFEDFNPALPDKYRHTPFVFLGNIHPSLQAAVLDQVEQTQVVALDTMNFWISSTPDELKAVLRRVDILLINDEEVFELSGGETLLQAAEKTLQLGPRYLIVKRGEYGALLFGPDFRLFVPAMLLPQVIDPTGAGDSFAGGFMGYLTEKKSLDRASLAGALLRGTVMASFSVEAFSVDGLCDMTEAAINRRLEELEGMLP